MATILDQDKKNEKDVQGQASATAGAGSPANAGVSAKPAASGNFTNVQSFLNANKQAGQKIAGNIQQGITGQLGASQDATQQGIQKTNQAVTGGQQKLQEGQSLLSSVKGPEFVPQTFTNPYGQQVTTSAPGYITTGAGNNAQGFGTNYSTAQRNVNPEIGNIANDANKLQAWTGYRTGDTLAQSAQQADVQRQQAAQQASQFQQQQEQRQRQLATEKARSGLLNEFVGGQKYGAGTQTLDNAFLQKQGSAKLDALKSMVANQYGGAVKQSQADIGSAGAQIGNLRSGGSELSKGISDTLASRKDQMKSGLTDLMNSINTARSNAGQWVEDQAGRIVPAAGAQKQNISRNFANLLGLSGGERMIGIGAGDALNSIDRSGLQQASSIADVATQQDADYAKMLQALSGDSSAMLSGASSLSNAALTSDFSNKLKANTNRFKEAAVGDLIRGQAEDINSYGTVADYLSGRALHTGGNAKTNIDAKIGQSQNATVDLIKQYLKDRGYDNTTFVDGGQNQAVVNPFAGNAGSGGFIYHPGERDSWMNINPEGLAAINPLLAVANEARTKGPPDAPLNGRV